MENETNELNEVKSTMEKYLRDWSPEDGEIQIKGKDWSIETCNRISNYNIWSAILKVGDKTLISPLWQYMISDDKEYDREKAVKDLWRM